MKRKICVVTGSRAEYGLFNPLLRELAACPGLSLQLIVTGSHLLPEHGLTWKEIAKDGFPISAKVPILSRGKDTDMARAIAAAIAGISPALCRLRPQAVLLLGDRYETFAAAVSAFTKRIPIAHLYGGETTEGALDEGFRHSITKMSSLHFVSTPEYRRRVIQLGEDPRRVHCVGALGVDNALGIKFIPREELERDLCFSFAGKTALVTFHPETLAKETSGGQTRELLAALEAMKDLRVIFTMPNADPGSQAVLKMIKAFVRRHPDRCALFASLGRLRYLSAMKYAGITAGNSSSGIMEAPSFGKPVVDIGGRQKGRVAARSVIHCRAERAAIVKALKLAFTPAFRRLAAAAPNPYGDGKAAARICAILRRSVTDAPAAAKKFYDL